VHAREARHAERLREADELVRERDVEVRQAAFAEQIRMAGMNVAEAPRQISDEHLRQRRRDSRHVLLRERRVEVGFRAGDVIPQARGGRGGAVGHRLRVGGADPLGGGEVVGRGRLRLVGRDALHERVALGRLLRQSLVEALDLVVQAPQLAERHVADHVDGTELHGQRPQRWCEYEIGGIK
jgi:hypothetical protein